MKNVYFCKIIALAILETIRINKGLDIPIGGRADRQVLDVRSIECYAVKPSDVVGFVPRLLVAEGDSVKAGQPLVVDKGDERLFLPSPIDGTVCAIVRGEKRKLMEVVIKGKRGIKVKGETKAAPFSPQSPCWWMLRERPFGIIANPDHKPKGIYVSMRDTNPLAPDIDFSLQGREQEFESGVRALKEYAPVHVVRAEGPHPAGNVGTIIAALDPINKGECVWTVGAQDVANIGRWCLTGDYCPERVIAVGGPDAKFPKYYRVLCGACLKSISDTQLMNPNYPRFDVRNDEAANKANPESGNYATRIISGSPLSGTIVAPDGFLGMYDHQVVFLPEGNYYDFMGWLMPGFRKFSFSRTFLSGFMPKSTFKPMDVSLPRFENYWRFDTNTHGDVRPLVFTGNFERVFPFNVFPTQLLKACIVGDLELMENLGIYEVEPEDFALCEFIDTSKTDIQAIIREALEKLRKEAV